MTNTDSLVYLRNDRCPDGGFLPAAEAWVRPDDRGFQFGDGVYEVIRSYQGRLFMMDRHLVRLRRSLAELRIEPPDLAKLGPVAGRLLEANRLGATEALVYIQVTRGAAPRGHAFPQPPVLPTIFVQASAFAPEPGAAESGVMALIVPDIRWHRCDIKTVCLLPNALARQQAREAGASDAIFCRDGFITEGTHTNVFGVRDGIIHTHPLGPHILDGITRQIALEICAAEGIEVRETPIPEQRLDRLDELFLAGTTVEITPVVRLERGPVGEGVPGPVTRLIQAGFRNRLEPAPR